MIMGLAELAAVERKLSTERLAPYRAAANGDAVLAIRLYQWNTEISAALGSTIGHLEVLLRNTLNDALTSWSTARFGEPRWYLDPGRILNHRAEHDIDIARRRAIRGGRAETNGRVTTELTFGFWRYLLTSHYERTLWMGCLRPAFPGLYRQGMRRDLDTAVSALHLARNRMAHLEPMFNRPIADLQTTALRVAGWICPASRDWVAAQCRVPELLGRFPAP